MPEAPARFKDICLDATAHQLLADWWCGAIGYRRAHPRDDENARPADWPVLLVPAEGGGPPLWINLVPEPKAGKNRMHLDVVGDSTALQAAGATLVRRRDGQVDWDVLADPEGNEFCCFRC